MSLSSANDVSDYCHTIVTCAGLARVPAGVWTLAFPFPKKHIPEGGEGGALGAIQVPFLQTNQPKSSMRTKSLNGLLLSLMLFELLGAIVPGRAQEDQDSSSASSTSSEVSFTAASLGFASTNIGSPSVSGSVSAVAGGYDITAGGT